MTTLRQELDRLVHIRDKHAINEIKQTMDNVLEDVFTIMDNKLDMWLPILKEQEQLRQINYNRKITIEALRRII
jgi:hypothetical protein